jgi:predicted Zn-dependent peptidase
MAKKSITQRSLPGADDIYRVVLSNGITILTRSNFNSPSVAISGYLWAGALTETTQTWSADFVASSRGGTRNAV